jgi:hypothetical protein
VIVDRIVREAREVLARAAKIEV